MNIVKTKTADGYHFNGLLSQSQTSKKIIIHFHGMAGSVLLNDFYPAMHEYYSQNGFSFLVGENRGTGSITAFVHDQTDGICGNAFERFEDCVLDIQAWIDFAHSLGYEDIWLQSHSLGPSKVAHYIIQSNPTDIKGLVWISPSDMLGLVNYPSGKSDHLQMLAESEQFIKTGNGHQLLSRKLWGDILLSANTYINFFGPQANTAIFNFENEQLGWETVNKVNLPVLAITGTKDDGIVTVCDPHNAMKRLTEELIRSPRIKTIVYEGADHSFTGFGNRIAKDVIKFTQSSE